MSISVDGISTGLNTTQLISELSAAFSRPKTLLENKVTNLNQLKGDYASLSSRLAAAQTSLEAIQGSDKLRSFSSTISNEDAFSVTLDEEAIAGSYSIQVNNTATSAVSISNSIADSSSILNVSATSISFDYGGTTHSVSIDAGSDLTDVVGAINSEVSGVTAYIMNTGSNYRLVVQGESTGATNVIENMDLTNLGMSEDSANSITAQNAEIELNGIAISSETNTFLDPIQGMTLVAKQSTSTDTDPTVDLVVSLDTTAISNKVNAFVNMYNDAINFVNARNKYDADANTIGTFVGEASVRNILNNLSAGISKQYTGVGNTSLDSVSQMGFKTNKDGTLTFTASEFTAAYTNYKDDVEALFSKTTGSFAASMVEKLDVFSDPLLGQLKSTQDGIAKQVTQLDKQVERWEKRIISYESRLRSSFTALESITGKLNGTKSFLTAFFPTGTKKS